MDEDLAPPPLAPQKKKTSVTPLDVSNYIFNSGLVFSFYQHKKKKRAKMSYYLLSTLFKKICSSFFSFFFFGGGGFVCF